MDHNPYSALSRLCYKYSCSSCDVRRILGIMAEELEQIKEEAKKKEGDNETKGHEEPKKYWVVDYLECGVDKLTYDPGSPEIDEFNKQIGNYFETEEEAEKAVEKLRAWKRLKDKGLRFCAVDRYEALCGNGFDIPITATMPPEAYTDVEASKDLDLLFGGGE